MSAAISFFTKNVVAGVDRCEVINVAGALFLCKEASAPFYMQFDDAPRFPLEGGFSLRPPGGFKRITIFNQSADEDLTVTFYVGNTFVSYDYLKTPKTRLVATAYTLNALDERDRPGINNGNRRKQILITNTSTTGVAVDVIDKDSGTKMLRVYDSETKGLETDADVRIKNPSATSATIVFIAETFYTS